MLLVLGMRRFSLWEDYEEQNEIPARPEDSQIVGAHTELIFDKSYGYKSKRSRSERHEAEGVQTPGHSSGNPDAGNGVCVSEQPRNQREQSASGCPYCHGSNPACNGSGGVDTGGTNPWGSSIYVPCC